MIYFICFLQNKIYSAERRDGNKWFNYKYYGSNDVRSEISTDCGADVIISKKLADFLNDTI